MDSMMKSTLALSLVVGALACATQVEVTTVAEPGVDFSRFRTYAIVAPAAGRPEVRERLMHEIAREFEARGYGSAPKEQAELLVVFQGSTYESVRRVYGSDPNAGCCVIQDYVEGTLVIDLFDSDHGPRIWHGVGRVDLRSDKEIERAATDAAKAILAKLPETARGAPAAAH